MDQIISFINTHVQYAPLIIFGLLLLAGFNIPVSEDGMILISALLAVDHPQQIIPLFAGVYLGAYLSDLISYSLGRFLGPKLWEIKFFSKMVGQKRIDDISNFYHRFGIITLIIGRFIPFGVRNALFVTAGLGKMRFFKFAVSDLIACTISTVTFFSLYYKLGPTVIRYVKKGNLILFSIVIIVVLTIYLMSKKDRKKH